MVHNGIIENYAELKGELLLEGCNFFSETDSEVIPHLINKYYEGDFLCAVTAAIKRLKGSYALCIMHKNFNGVIAACNKSPVILGYGDGEYFMCSDAPALAETSQKISVLCDGDIAVVTEKSVKIYNAKNELLSRDKVANFASKACLDLGDCPHYMLKEMREVPTAVQNTLSACGALDLQKLRTILTGVDKVVLTGCGTAFHTCLIARDWIEEFCGIYATAETAGEWRYKKSPINDKTLVVAVSQSGETADTLEAAKLAKSCGAKVLAVTNVGYSAITRVAHFTIPVVAGAEICVAATKSYCAQLISLWFLTSVLQNINGCASDKLFKRTHTMPELCQKTLQNLCIDSLCEQIKNAHGVYFIGRGLDCAVAREGSLKLKEVSLKPGEGYAAGELKHGTLALIDKNTYTIAVLCDENLCEKTLSAIKQITARGGKVAAVCSVKSFIKKLKEVCDYVIQIPECDRALSPIISVLPLQYIAYKVAVLCGCDPDKPRNLAKSVTVE